MPLMMNKNTGAMMRLEQYLKAHCFDYKFLPHDNGDVLALFNERGTRVFSVVAVPMTEPKTELQEAYSRKKPLLLIDHRVNFRDLEMTFDECSAALHDALENRVIARKII